jgi:hypothetical protein
MFKKMLKNEKGLGIAITILSLVLISVLGTALVIRSITLANVITRKNYSITAVESAKAGVSYAIYQLNNDKSWASGVSVTPLTTYTVTGDNVRGYYKIEVVNNINGSAPMNVPGSYEDIINISSLPAGKVAIISTGYTGYLSATSYKAISRVFAIGSAYIDTISLGKNAITGKNQITVQNGKIVSLSPDPNYAYNTSDPNTYANIAVNSTLNNAIVGAPQALIEGIAYSGPESDPNITISGLFSKCLGTATLPVAEPLPDPVAPSLGNLIPPSGNPLPPNKAYTNLNSSTTLMSGDYIFNSVDLTGQDVVKLQISNDPNGNPIPVRVYLTGDAKFTGNGIYNVDDPNSSLASNFIIYGCTGCEDIMINGNGNTYSVVYAPNSDVKIGGNGYLYGAITANNFSFSGANAQLAYDPRLNNLKDKITSVSDIDTANITWSWSYGY